MKLQKGFLIYLVVNTIYIMPILLSAWCFPESTESMILRYYIMSMILYYFFGTFIHIIFAIVVAIRSVRLYKQNKSKKMFCLSLIITIAAVLSNVMWAITGRPWTIQ